MQFVKVTRAFKSVAREGDVYPKLYNIGDLVHGYPAEVALATGAGEIVGTDGSAPAEAAGASGAGNAEATVEDTPPPPVVKAKTLRALALEIDGQIAKFAKGAIVEGALAERLIAERNAVRIADNKSRGPAPEQG